MENLRNFYAVATFLTLCGFNHLFLKLLPYYREYCSPDQGTSKSPRGRVASLSRTPVYAYPIN